MQCLPFGEFDGFAVDRCSLASYRLGLLLHFDALVCGPEQGELVLLLHGFPQFADSRLPIMPQLARAGYRAVAVDQRGYSSGARPLDVQAYSIANLVSDVMPSRMNLARPAFTSSATIGAALSRGNSPPITRTVSNRSLSCQLRIQRPFAEPSGTISIR